MSGQATRLGLALSPAGHWHLAAEPEAPALTESAAARLSKAFTGGSGTGLLFLATAALTWELPPSLAFGRELGRTYLTRFCYLPDPEAVRASFTIPAPEGELSALVLSAPPMSGAEYLDVPRLSQAWRLLEEAVRNELAGWDGDVASWLKERHPLWNQVGRVTFHLAENKASPEMPFAFLATYTTRVSREGRVQHAPLGRALSHGAADRGALLALLIPIQRAAEKSAFVKDLVDSGRLFHPLPLPPAEAHRLLREAPAVVESGIVLKLPDWWTVRPPRPEVVITVGTKPAAGLGLDAILDFSMELALGGERLTRKELADLLAAGEGLVRLRGRWVEVDRQKLEAALEQWRKLEQGAGDGLSLLEGMRLLAGAPLTSASTAASAPAREFSRVVAGEWLENALAELRDPSAAPVAALRGRLAGTLRPYQERGVAWMQALSRLGLGGCLADDMGLGKTIQVIALLLLNQREGVRSLLVVPASLLSNWMAELERFGPSLRAAVAHPSAMSSDELAALPRERLRQLDVVVTTYGTLLRQPWICEMEWALAVLDEAQAIKNPSAKQTRAAKSIRSRVRMALTGTPVENRLGDLWSIFDYICPGLLGSPKEFTGLTRRLAEAKGGYAPLKALVRPYILRRLKTDRSVIADLPEKTEVTAYCQLARPQAALYERSVSELKARLERLSGIERRGVVLSYLMRLKQICNHPSQWTDDGVFEPRDSGKFHRLRELCEEIASRQEKALIFTQFRQMTAPLAGYLATVFGRSGLVLDGTTQVSKRRGLVQAFQDEDGPPFFVLSVKAGGTGLNLTAASHVIHFDRWWNPAVEDQATDRAFRIGQKRNVLVHKLVCRGTVEERIDALLAAKKGLSRELLDGGGELLLTELPDDELLRLVSLDLKTALSDEESG